METENGINELFFQSQCKGMQQRFPPTLRGAEPTGFLIHKRLSYEAFFLR